MDLEQELAESLTTNLARELILEKNEVLDEALFHEVMRHITGETGSGNAFDAPILYELVKNFRSTK